MKRFFSILALVAFTFALVSCGDDDNNEVRTWPETITDSKNYTFEILTSANADFSIPVTMKLEDFAQLGEWTGKVRNAEAKANSFIKIAGVSAGGYTFETLTLQVEGTNIKRVFKNVKEDGTFNTVDTDLDFLNSLAKRLGDRSEIVVKLSGKTDKEVNKNVKVSINLNVLFHMK